MALRLVSANTTRLDIGDDGDWIEVKEDLSRRDFNRIISTLPVNRDGLNTDEIDLDTATSFAEALFDVFVEDWSVTDSDSNKVKANVANYQLLDRASSQLIDAQLSEYFNGVIAVSDEDAQKSEESGV